VLAIALEAFAATDNFRDAVLHAANRGGNSDVAATACGQLAGAHYGASAIPAPWRDCLLQRNLIETYADRLLQHALLKMG
jgi:ADP-ribosyl-[dinitrogen reductase] hydrolase